MSQQTHFRYSNHKILPYLIWCRTPCRWGRRVRASARVRRRKEGFPTRPVRLSILETGQSGNRAERGGGGGTTLCSTPSRAFRPRPFPAFFPALKRERPGDGALWLEGRAARRLNEVPPPHAPVSFPPFLSRALLGLPLPSPRVARQTEEAGLFDWIEDQRPGRVPSLLFAREPWREPNELACTGVGESSESRFGPRHSEVRILSKSGS